MHIDDIGSLLCNGLDMGIVREGSKKMPDMLRVLQWEAADP